MPYIAIKCYPKDDATKKAVVEKINEVFLEHWGCPPEAITVSLEEFPPEQWHSEIYDKEILPKKDMLYIHKGEKLY